MADKADKPSKGRPKAAEAPNGGSTPITPIAKSGLADAIKHGGRIYQMMVESVRDYAIFMLDPAGYIASWNQGAQRIKGYTADEIIGRHFSVFYTDQANSIGHPQHELEIATRDGRFEEEGWRVRKDGTMFWASVIITAVRDETGTLLGFAKVTRDLTERRNAEQRNLADARRLAEAESANAAKAEFLTAMSHELRTPLNAIGGYTELLTLGLGGPVTAEQSDYLERIRHSQQHLMGIISDLLNFSRIEAGHITYDIAPVPLISAINSAIPLIQPQTEAKGVFLTADPTNSDCVALADRAKVDQILLNLLSNAVKFTNAGGTIRIQCLANEKNVLMNVIDTGVGIPADKLEAIFEPFVQLGRSLSSAHEGTGLGLAISRDLARAMSGDLTVTSKSGAGSTFTLRLPRPPAPSTESKGGRSTPE
ncbi:MAG TPA: ATP-binding protein [Gemmatimonadaceae bacterium]|jgi:PAS domain S-box-containing protein|nr:ATP-binding protein [Gemmatimonadaceae bacterium]